MPGPVSMTAIVNRPGPAAGAAPARKVTPPRGVNFNALPTRLVRMRRSSNGSVLATSGCGGNSSRNARPL